MKVGLEQNAEWMRNRRQLVEELPKVVVLEGGYLGTGELTRKLSVYSINKETKHTNATLRVL